MPKRQPNVKQLDYKKTLQKEWQAFTKAVQQNQEESTPLEDIKLYIQIINTALITKILAVVIEAIQKKLKREYEVTTINSATLLPEQKTYEPAAMFYLKTHPTN